MATTRKFRIPASRLPAGKLERVAALRSYFHEWVPTISTDADGLLVELHGPPRADYLVDPAIKDGLKWWGHAVGHATLRTIYEAHGSFEGVSISLSDAWTAVTFAPHLTTSRPVVILHVDDHDDLMSPRVGWSGAGVAFDLLDESELSPNDPDAIGRAVAEGFVGMGSMLTMSVIGAPRGEIRHLRATPHRMPGRPNGRYPLAVKATHDSLLNPTATRPEIEIGTTRKKSKWWLSVTDDPTEWTADIPIDATVLLHVDFDYFNNRYDGDSDWAERKRILDPSLLSIESRIDAVLAALDPVRERIAATHLALSPGFFPAEFWKPAVERVARALSTVPGQRVHATGTSPTLLEKGRGSSSRGGDPGGHFWWVFHNGSKAGRVWININEDGRIGRHFSLSIELNKQSQGRGVGTTAYRLAAEQSGLDEIWLHMKKSNLPSRRAAEKAGYEVVEVSGERQLVMRWTRT